MSTTATRSAVPATRTGPRLSHHAEHAVQRVADASVWLLFRLNGVRS